jgi:hypothetical protein
MYIIFFLLLGGLAYGALFFRSNPVILILGITATVFLMLAPMNDDVVFTNVMTTNATTTIETDETVLFSLNEGYEYTTWIWLHVALLIVHVVFFFAYMMRTLA